MADDLGGEAMTMIERDGGAHHWNMPQEQSDYISPTFNLTVPYVVSKLKCPFLIASEVSGLGFLIKLFIN